MKRDENLAAENAFRANVIGRNVGICVGRRTDSNLIEMRLAKELQAKSQFQNQNRTTTAEKER